MTTYPTDEAWGYFTQNLADIRSCVERYLPVPRLEVPNTRSVDENDCVILRPSGEEQRASIPFPIQHTIADFDAAVEARDSEKLTIIMNDCWLRLPEDRSIYSEPGVAPMCDLLDGIVDGFYDIVIIRDGDDEESAF